MWRSGTDVNVQNLKRCLTFWRYINSCINIIVYAVHRTYVLSFEMVMICWNSPQEPITFKGYVHFLWKMKMWTNPEYFGHPAAHSGSDVQCCRCSAPYNACNGKCSLVSHFFLLGHLTGRRWFRCTSHWSARSHGCTDQWGMASARIPTMGLCIALYNSLGALRLLCAAGSRGVVRIFVVHLFHFPWKGELTL